MCQRLLVFFKEVEPFSIASIASCKASIIHLLHSVRVKNLFVLIDLFVCDALVSGMLSIFIVGCFGNPLHHLQGILNIMAIPCFLSLAYNKLEAPIQDLQEV
jgi:hypothetical protein